ncbi:hypothetical protein ACFQ1S_22550 [Kibdelosporangium lantanae]|uniref:Uncharacterized protein n=1 Tax=Kibdelosporangium lantanae TaxID=1497396 RepID=A0ABW3MBF4_9PSEU
MDTEIRLVAAQGATRVVFEPLGEMPELRHGEFACPRVPLVVVATAEIHIWPRPVSASGCRTLPTR